MEAVFNKTSLLNELVLLSSIIEKKTTIPVLNNVLVDVTAEGVNLTGTDLDVSMQTSCDAEIITPGSIGVSAKKLHEIVKSLPDRPIRIKSGENDQVTVTCDKTRFKVPGVSKDAFPEVKQPPAGRGFELPPLQWSEIVTRTYCAITNEESRYALNGGKIEWSEKYIRVITTDGHRLAFIEMPGDYSAIEPGSLLIPKKSFAESGKLAAGATSLTFKRTPEHLFFIAGKRVLGSRLLSGQFPNYELVLPKENKIKIVVDAAALDAVIARAALMADERSHAIRMTFGENQIQVEAQSSETGEGASAVEVEYTGEQIAAGFSWQYLRDFLTPIGGNVELHIKDGSAQFEIRSEAEKRWLGRFIVMPMRLD